MIRGEQKLYAEFVIVSFAFLVTVFGGDPVVRVILMNVEKNMSPGVKRQLEKGSVPDAGRYIGYLERALVFLLVIAHQSGSIAFIIAAKAIIRFESAKHRPFAEYFLVGTFASILFAMILPILLVFLQGF